MSLQAFTLEAVLAMFMSTVTLSSYDETISSPMCKFIDDIEVALAVCIQVYCSWGGTVYNDGRCNRMHSSSALVCSVRCWRWVVVGLDKGSGRMWKD